MAFDLHKFSRAIAWSFVEMLSLSQLLYRFLTGDSAGTWTQDPQIKSLVLWPTELRSHLSIWRCKGNMPDRSLFSFPKKSSFFLQKTPVFLKKDKGNASFHLVSKCITIMRWWQSATCRSLRQRQRGRHQEAHLYLSLLFISFMTGFSRFGLQK